MDCSVSLAHVPSADTEREMFITYAAASHQRAIKMFWLHFQGAVMLFIFIYSQCFKDKMLLHWLNLIYWLKLKSLKVKSAGVSGAFEMSITWPSLDLGYYFYDFKIHISRISTQPLYFSHFEYCVAVACQVKLNPPSYFNHRKLSAWVQGFIEG